MRRKEDDDREGEGSLHPFPLPPPKKKTASRKIKHRDNIPRRNGRHFPLRFCLLPPSSNDTFRILSRNNLLLLPRAKKVFSGIISSRKSYLKIAQNSSQRIRALRLLSKRRLRSSPAILFLQPASSSSALLLPRS